MKSAHFVSSLALALVVPSLGGSGGPTQPGVLPADHYRISLAPSVEANGLLVTQLTISTSPGARVEISDGQPGGAKGMLIATTASAVTDPPGSPALVRLAVVIDHVTWEAKGVNVLKVSWILAGNGTASASATGAMTKKRLAEAVTVSIKPGLYPCGKPLEVLQLQGDPFRLTVRESRATVNESKAGSK
jgi:hypothetical protein